MPRVSAMASSTGDEPRPDLEALLVPRKAEDGLPEECVGLSMAGMCGTCMRTPVRVDGCQLLAGPTAGVSPPRGAGQARPAHPACPLRP